VVDSQGKFLQQRVLPQMSRVQAGWRGDGCLTIDAPGMPSLQVAVPQAGPRQTVTVWRDTISALDAGNAAAAWFSRLLGCDCRLVHMDADAHRPVAAEYGQPGDVVSFADAAPLLLATEASLADLNRRLEHPVSMSRFRPNVTIDGVEPWAEDHWRRIRIGQVEFEITHRCARCVVTTIDQQTGVKDPQGEPLKTLAAFRRDEKGIYFGQNLIPRGTGPIRVGDPVEILSRDR
jgi:uncharacterized protein YcbX